MVDRSAFGKSPEVGEAKAGGWETHSKSAIVWLKGAKLVLLPVLVSPAFGAGGFNS